MRTITPSIFDHLDSPIDLSIVNKSNFVSSSIKNPPMMVMGYCPSQDSNPLDYSDGSIIHAAAAANIMIGTSIITPPV